MSSYPRLLDWGTPDCHKFRVRILKKHAPIAAKLERGFLEAAKEFADPVQGNAVGNAFLREADRRLKLGRGWESTTMDEESIRNKARIGALRAGRIYQVKARRTDFNAIVGAVREWVEREGLKWPAEHLPGDTEEVWRKKSAGALARAKDPKWWRRQLRARAAKVTEQVLRECGAVCKGVSPYVSDWCFTRWMASQRRNANLLESLVAVADDGTELPLIDCVEASVANPTNRRNELMTRMRGWEEIAKALKLEGALVTITCPSAYHPRLSKSGEKNPKYNGSNPAEAMAYLNTVWSRIRSALARRQIRTFGFRMCEPHHSGTPHFHLLIFVSPADVQSAKEIIGHYALEKDGEEPGAVKNRWDWIRIDPAIGSATGYVAKYVSKNIDGHGFAAHEVDEEGQVPANVGALRVRAWASTWGIRQFDQIGSASVTVWRELRRLRNLDEMPPGQIEALRKAADAGNWAEFVELMGGPYVSRQDQSLRALHVLSERPGAYGDEIRRILGVVMRGVGQVITRTKVWEVYPKWMLDERSYSASNFSTGDNRAPPWSSVNNCT